MFEDRVDAGHVLAKAIQFLKLDLRATNGIVLALPRGGVVVADQVAHELGLPLDICVTRKIGAYLNPEYAVAAVGEHIIVLNPEEKIDPVYVADQARLKRQEIERRTELYRNGKPPASLQGKTVILVDDGMATALTMRAAIEEVKLQNPSFVVVAVPVAPPAAIDQIKKMADKIVVVSEPEIFFAIGEYYADFGQVSDEKVIEILRKY